MVKIPTKDIVMQTRNAVTIEAWHALREKPRGNSYSGIRYPLEVAIFIRTWRVTWTNFEEQLKW